MDPISAIGLVSSVGAIASGAVQLAQTLNLYYEKTKRAESDVRAIVFEVELSADVLQKLSDLLEESQRVSSECALFQLTLMLLTRPSTDRYHRLFSSVQSSLRRCQELFVEIREALLKVVRIVPAPENGDPGIEFLNIKRSLWPMRQQRIEILRGEM